MGNVNRTGGKTVISHLVKRVTKKKRLTTRQTVTRIISLNAYIADFWSKADGWAPAANAALLSKSRLDRQVQLSRTLRRSLRKPPANEHDGALILAWANLGSLVEGTMKWFLCVFVENYASHYKSVAKTAHAAEPDGLMFENLRQFFKEKVWDADECAQWMPLVSSVQQRRNAIHAYKDRDIATFAEFRKAVEEYFCFLEYHHSRVPYPDSHYGWNDGLG